MSERREPRRFADQELHEFHIEFLQLKDDVEQMSEDRKALCIALENNTQAIKAVQTALESAFPDGDGVAHRIAHEAWIEAKKEERDFWRSVKLDLAKKGIWAILISLTALAFSGLLLMLKDQLGRLLQ